MLLINLIISLPGYEDEPQIPGQQPTVAPLKIRCVPSNNEYLAQKGSNGKILKNRFSE